MDTTLVSKLRGKIDLSHKTRRWILILAAVLVLIGAGAFAYYKLAYVPSQTTTTATVKTSVVRQGDLVIRASGTGTLTSASTASFGFKTSGQLIKLNVAVGDTVKKGQLLGQLDNSSAQIALTQAKRALNDLMSANSIATAQQAVATAQSTLTETKNQLMYLISPSVFTYEGKVAAAQTAVDQAQAAFTASSTADNQKALDTAKLKLKSMQSLLSGAKINYTTNYLKWNFTVTKFDMQTHTRTKYIAAPTDADIAAARAAYSAAQAALVEAQNYVTVLTGGDVSGDATGTSLSTLETAKLNVETAQNNLDATTLTAPIDGTVMSISANLGDTVSSSAIITISDLSQPTLEGYFDSTDWDKIKVGYPAEITFDNIDNTIFKGTVTEVAPGLTTSGNTSVVSAVVKIDDSAFSSSIVPVGSSAGIDVIAAQAKNAILVPIEALHEIDTNQYGVFVMVNGKPTVRMIEIGIKDLFNAEVKSGLKVGDVVTTGTVTSTGSSTTSGSSSSSSTSSTKGTN